MLDNRAEFETLRVMPDEPEKTHGEGNKNEVIVTEDTIIITLNEKQKKKVREFLKSGKAKFKIDDIEIEGIPSVRVHDGPIHPCQ